MELEVRHLKLVRAVAALGGLTSAGRELHLTQSALSHQLRDVETRLGTPLFLRIGKRMVLTTAGERLLRSADEILGTLARTEDAIRGLAGGRRGRLRVTTGGYTEFHWLPPVLKAFRASCPTVDLQIVSASNVGAGQLLLEGLVDVGIVDHAVDDARLLMRPLFDDDVVVIVPPGHALAAKAYMLPHDFADQTLLLDLPPHDHPVFQRVLAPAGISPERVQVVPQTGAMVELVKAGLGIGFIARWVVEPMVRAGGLRAIPVSKRGETYHWNALVLKDLAEANHVREFLIIMMKVFNRTLKDNIGHTRASLRSV
jgi:LysR family transcriptional regulator for metE and metH